MFLAPLLSALGLSTLQAVHGGTYDRTLETVAVPPLDRTSVVETIGDLDGDTIPEILVGMFSPTVNIGGFAVYRGSDRTVLYSGTESGTAQGKWFGYDAAGGVDVGGDGVPDFMVSYPLRPGSFFGRVELFDGRTGASVNIDGGPTINELGLAVEMIGDLDNDNLGELLLMDRTRVRVMNGNTQAVIRRHKIEPFQTDEGTLLEALPDLDGDMVPEYAIGMPLVRLKLDEQGVVAVFSGATGNRLWVHAGEVKSSFVGSREDTLTALDDWTGDSIPELLMISRNTLDKRGLRRGHAWVLNGATGEPVWDLKGHFTAPFGSHAQAVGDWDQDGRVDFGFMRGGVFWVLSGATQDALVRMSPPWPNADSTTFGSRYVDLNGDNREELVLGAHSVTFSGGPGPVSIYESIPCLSSQDNTINSGPGGTITLSLDFPVLHALYDYSLLMSVSGVGPTFVHSIPVPLNSDKLFRQSLAQKVFYPLQIGQLNFNGDKTVDIIFPPNALNKLVGGFLFFSAISSVGGTVQAASEVHALRVR